MLLKKKKNIITDIFPLEKNSLKLTKLFKRKVIELTTRYSEQSHIATSHEKSSDSIFPTF